MKRRPPRVRQRGALRQRDGENDSTAEIEWQAGP
jgi:hypothetical protein